MVDQSVGAELFRESQLRSQFLFMKVFSLLTDFNSRVRPFLQGPSESENNLDPQFHFVAKAFTENPSNPQGLIPYLLGNPFDEVIKQIPDVTKSQQDWKAIVQRARHNTNADAAAKKIKDLLENRETNNLKSNEKEEMHTSFLNVVLNYPLSTKIKTVDTIVYDHQTALSDLIPVLAWATVHENHKVKVTVGVIKSQGTSLEWNPDSDWVSQEYKEEKFYYDDILRHLLPQPNPKATETHIFFFPLYASADQKNGLETNFGHFLGFLVGTDFPSNWDPKSFFPIGDADKARELNLARFRLASEQFKSGYSQALKDEFLTQDFVTGQTCTNLICSKIGLLGIWSNAKPSDSLDHTQAETYVLRKDSGSVQMEIRWKDLIQKQQRLLPLSLQVTDEEALESPPQVLLLNFDKDFIWPVQCNLVSGNICSPSKDCCTGCKALMNSYLKLLLELYFGLRKRKGNYSAKRG